MPATGEGADAEAVAPPPATERTSVQVAFSLGWHLAELFHADVPLSTPAPPDRVDDLPGFGELDGLTRARFTFRALAETSLLPKAGERDTFATAFAPYRLSTMDRWLSDLKSLFPPHAAQAVSGSMTDWARWARQPAMALWSEASGEVTGTRPVDWGSPADLGRVTRAVRRQGEVWRSILSGEKQPLDLLSADDYVRAG